MVLVYVVFESMDHFTQSIQGRTGSFWVDGTNVNAAIVIVCNLKILYETNTHTWQSACIFAGSIISFYLYLWWEQMYHFFPNVYLIFPEMFTTHTILCMLLCAWWNFLVYILVFQGLRVVKKCV